MGLAYVKFPSGQIDNDILTDPSYFSVSFSNTEYRRNSEGFEVVLHSIPYGYWNDTFSDIVSEELSDRISLDKYLCPSTDDYYLVGDFNSKVFRDIEIFITPCKENNTEGVVWKSKDEIDLVTQTGYINTAITRSYFDFDDFNDPVKTSLSQSDNHFMVLNSTTWIEYFVQESTALSSDNYVYNEPFKETTFYDTSPKSVQATNQVATGGAVALITIGPDARTTQYERTVYSLLDLFGYLGGLNDFMFIAGLWFVGSIQNKIFYNLKFSNMYQVKSARHRNDDEHTSSMQIMEESKANIQMSTLNTRTSVSNRFNFNQTLPKTQSQDHQVSRIDDHDINHCDKKIDSLRVEWNSRRMYTFQLHHICCPIFK